MRSNLVRTLGSSALLIGTLALSVAAYAQTPADTKPADQAGNKTAEQPATKPADTPTASTNTPIVVGGAIEANYTYNFNRPFNNNNYYGYNNKEGQFALNLAEIKISKAVDTNNRAGFVVRLIDGEVKRLIFIPGESTTHVLEGYGTFLIPVGKTGKDLTVDLGQFVTHVGYETVEVGTNSFFSRNFLFQIPEPTYNAGLRVSYAASPKLTLNGYLYNRYNGTNDTGNRDLAPGFQIAISPNANSSFIVNGLFSRENLAYKGDNGTKTDKNNQMQNIIDVIYSNQFTPKFRLVGEGLYRFGKDADHKSYGAYGVAGYLIFTTNKRGDNFAIRGEYYKQDKVIAIGGAGVNQLVAYPDPANAGDKVNLSSVTVAYELKTPLIPNAKTIFEYRFDNAGKPFFGKTTDDTYKKNQSTLTVGEVFRF